MNVYCDLNEEVRDGYLVTKDTKRLWNIQLNMVVRFMDVCNKYHLQFAMDGGTMLGAVRHKGYIPWDDDIDIHMRREYYDKLVKIASKEFTSPYFFQCAYTEKGYYRGHAQMRYDNTTMILPYEGKIGRKFNQGIFIDIFPIDALPEDNEKNIRIGNEADNILNYLWMRHNPKERLLGNYRKVRKNIGNKKDWSDIQLYEYFENLFRQENLSDSKYCAKRFFTFSKRVFKTEWFENVIYVPFEKIKVPIPASYDEFLTEVYGDYMKPVISPSTHGSVILDMDKPYTEYLNNLEMGNVELSYRILRKYAGATLRKLGLRKKKQ